MNTLILAIAGFGSVLLLTLLWQALVVWRRRKNWQHEKRKKKEEDIPLEQGKPKGISSSSFLIFHHNNNKLDCNQVLQGLLRSGFHLCSGGFFYYDGEVGASSPLFCIKVGDHHFQAKEIQDLGTEKLFLELFSPGHQEKKDLEVLEKITHAIAEHLGASWKEVGK